MCNTHARNPGPAGKAPVAAKNTAKYFAAILFDPIKMENPMIRRVKGIMIQILRRFILSEKYAQVIANIQAHK